MNLVTMSYVPVEAISCKTPNVWGDLKEEAEIGLKLGGLIVPIILKVIGKDGVYDLYEVVSGAKQYYTAVKMQEISENRMGNINAMILPKDNMELALKQLESFIGPVASEVVEEVEVVAEIVEEAEEIEEVVAEVVEVTEKAVEVRKVPSVQKVKPQVAPTTMTKQEISQKLKSLNCSQLDEVSKLAKRMSVEEALAKVLKQ